MNCIARPLILLVLLAGLAACGAGSNTPEPRDTLAPPTTVPTVAAPTARPAARAGRAEPGWPSELFFVRPEGAKGRLVAYDMSYAAERFSLPAGMLSADGKSYYAAQAGELSTTLTAFDSNTGNPRKSFALDGRWGLGGVSPTGLWLALTRHPAPNAKRAWTAANMWQTDIQIVDVSGGQAAHVITLDGNFEVETISAGGQALYLIEHLPVVKPDHYLIRLFDLSAEALQADPLRSKTSNEVMAGLAWEDVASPDGHWLLTLYLSTRRNVAFIHALDLIDKYPLCIDLPSGGGNFSQLKDYTLTLSPGGRKAYAANATLGVVAEVSLNELQVVRQVRFAAGPSAAAVYDTHAPTARCIISADGQMLYFTSGKDVWGYDAKTRKVSRRYVTDGQISGVGLSRDGQRPYVARLDRPSDDVRHGHGHGVEFSKCQ